MGLLAVLAGYNSTSSSASGGAAAGILIVYFIFIIGFYLLVVAGMWKAFEKAGQKGWLALIPFLNWYVIIKLVGRESWWIILFFIPCVSFVVAIILAIDLAKVFGKSEGFGIGLAFLPFAFYPMLGFGDARYQGPQVGPVI